MDRIQTLLDQPDNQDILDGLADFHGKIEQRLQVLLNPKQGLRLEQAMHRCIFAGGKRLRPKLTLMTAKVLGLDPEQALDPACAIEMFHTASLVLDDLPCMDNANERRGAPTCHLSFGEDIAILAAVTLITKAFDVLAASEHVASATKVKICSLLSGALGVQGLAAGQETDLRDMDSCNNLDAMAAMERNKTSALFEAAMQTAGFLASADEDKMQALQGFGRHLGLAFQIFDDLLDQLGSVDKTGKDHKQDEGRTTFATIVSASDAEACALKELDQSLEALENSNISTHELTTLIKTVFSQYRSQLSTQP